MPEDQLEREILDALVEEAPLSANEIAEHIDGHPLTVERVCDHLHDRGHIYALAQGRYDVTNSGTSRVGGEREFDPGPGGGAESEADT